LAPLIAGKKGEHRDLFEDLLKQGFVRARVDGDVISLSSPPSLDRQMRHHIEVVIDRLTAAAGLRTRLAEAVDLALKLGQGNLIVAVEKDEKSSDDMHLSAHYACTPCGLSFEPPSPQLFSFNSPHGMCPQCDGLGEVYGFDPALLVTSPEKTFKQGAIELIGNWADLGRWKRHIYQGVADTVEHKQSLAEGTILETPWNELAPELQNKILYGTGDLHITYTWRNGPSGHKYGGQYEGIIPELTSKYKQSQSGMQKRQLEKYMRVAPCVACHGARLNPQARAVTLKSRHAKFSSTAADAHPQSLKGERRNKAGLGLPEICHLSVADCVDFFAELELDEVRQKIAAEVLKEVRGRLGFLTNVGLEYLTLDRTAPTLSGGESQRIRLAGQIGCGLVGVLYILDEPSIGLHPRDNDRLIGTLERLRDLGNTVVVVEHDEDTMRAADYLIDFGPGPGIRGGEVVAAGDYAAVCREKRSVTGQFLSGD
jgi:excinuclease ABC subunit A